MRTVCIVTALLIPGFVFTGCTIRPEEFHFGGEQALSKGSNTPELTPSSSVVPQESPFTRPPGVSVPVQSPPVQQQERLREQERPVQPVEPTKQTRPEQETATPPEPPSPKSETIPTAPRPDYKWIPGAWTWQQGQWVWVRGRWERPPRPTSMWVPGRWERRGDENVWVNGRWR